MHSTHVRSSWPLLSRLLPWLGIRLVGPARRKDRASSGIRWVLMVGMSRAEVSKEEDGVNKEANRAEVEAGVNSKEEEVADGVNRVVSKAAVSYTHLTLPTILLV